jgi:hypothetical protein
MGLSSSVWTFSPCWSSLAAQPADTRERHPPKRLLIQNHSHVLHANKSIGAIFTRLFKPRSIGMASEVGFTRRGRCAAAVRQGLSYRCRRMGRRFVSPAPLCTSNDAKPDLAAVAGRYLQRLRRGCFEIALSELTETTVPPNLMWAEFRGGGTQRLKALIAFCREGGSRVASAHVSVHGSRGITVQTMTATRDGRSHVMPTLDRTG